MYASLDARGPCEGWCGREAEGAIVTVHIKAAARRFPTSAAVACRGVHRRGQGGQRRLIGRSALLTANMKEQRKIIKTVHDEGLTFKTFVVGALCTQRWTDQTGADACAEDAIEGVKKIEAPMALMPRSGSTGEPQQCQRTRRSRRRGD